MLTDPNADLIGFEFEREWRKGGPLVTWKVTGTSFASPLYINIATEGDVAVVLASFVRQAKTYADVMPGDVQTVLL